MKHIQEITYGQKVQLYKMSDGFIKRVNDRMDEEIKKKTFIDATDSLSAKIRKEYRIIQWLDKVDTDREINTLMIILGTIGHFLILFQSMMLG